MHINLRNHISNKTILFAICIVISGCGQSEDGQVNIVDDIGWWPYQNKVQIDAISASADNYRPSMFSSDPIVTFHLKGSMVGQPGWRPKLCKVHFSSRWLNPYRDTDTEPRANISIVPIVCVEEDKAYTNKRLPFEIEFKRKLSMGGWGKNHFVIEAANRSVALEFNKVK